MRRTIWISLLIISLVAASLACATLTGSNATPNPDFSANNDVQDPNISVATATVRVAPTATIEILPTAEPQPLIVFEDEFSDVNSGWDRFSDNEGITNYFNSAYKIGVYTDHKFFWTNPYRNFGDVIVEVQSQKISGGDDVQYGIICRHQDVDNWYVLVISGDGWAAIRKRIQGNDLEFIADWVEVSAANTGNATNDLRAECIGNRLSLYVNGTLAIEVFDSDIPTGDVGLLAGNFDQTNSEVLFDYFVVMEP
jgi:hypothetical protein